MGRYHLVGSVTHNTLLVTEELWVADGVIRLERPDDGPFETIEGHVLPGLVDVHCHVGLDSGGPLGEEMTLKQATMDRDAGTLLIREPGSPVDTGFLQGVTSAPRLIRAGRFIARPKRYIRGYAREIEAEDLPRVAAEEARKGDGWIKLVADWIDRDAGDLTPLWPGDVLKEAIAAAHDEGARVTAHTFSTEAIDDLLDAGIDCIEHGTGMTHEHFARAADMGVPVVPTLLQVANFAGFAAQGEAKFPRYAQRMRGMFERRYEHALAMWEAGVQLLTGTDAGGEVGHGELPAECLELQRAGIPPVEVLAAASWRAREFLGVDGIADGASADLVVYENDPRQDVRALATPSAVILRGDRFV
jgi:imidazolonepropionase-like amidohydrolase